MSHWSGSKPLFLLHCQYWMLTRTTLRYLVALRHADLAPLDQQDWPLHKLQQSIVGVSPGSVPGCWLKCPACRLFCQHHWVQLPYIGQARWVGAKPDLLLSCPWGSTVLPRREVGPALPGFPGGLLLGVFPVFVVVVCHWVSFVCLCMPQFIS